jgi:hypothetical protein
MRRLKPTTRQLSTTGHQNPRRPFALFAGAPSGAMLSIPRHESCRSQRKYFRANPTILPALLCRYSQSCGWRRLEQQKPDFIDLNPFRRVLPPWNGSPAMGMPIETSATPP